MTRLPIPAGVLWALEDPRSFRGPWLPAEAAAVARAVEKRRREFGCGRHLARGLLLKLGIEAGPLLPCADRRLPWPSPVVGSLSHCEDACVVVAALRQNWTSVGIDVEPDLPLRTETLNVVTTSEERSRFGDGLPPGDWGKASFVAKEAYYKAQYEMTRRRLEFSDVELRFDGPPAPEEVVGFEARSSKAPALRGWLSRSDGHVWALSCAGRS